jgi:molybdate-binding protein/transcriptional regulator with XRE-family HTH domain
MSWRDTIMSSEARFKNRLREFRLARGWSQEELANRAGLSRAGVSAIEIQRLIPSAAAALALARALGCRVEDLFSLDEEVASPPTWAWGPASESCRVVAAELAGKRLYFPVEASEAGVLAHDGVWHEGSLQWHPQASPSQTLVMACCDPAVGLLAAELARLRQIRLFVVPRSSRKALDLLRQGLVHVAGVHLSAHDAAGNADAARETLGAGFTLVRAAQWEEGIAVTPSRQVTSIRSALRAPLEWVGREPGSGARQCMDELFGRRREPKHLARDHRGVADAIRSGFADAGVCLRYSSELAGLDFLSVRQEAYDICFSTEQLADPRIDALLEVLRSPQFRQLSGELPGYDTSQTGRMEELR